MFLTIKRNFIWNGDDIYYQFQRIQNIIYSVRDAHTIPTISINNFGLIGYGINIFYPWVTLLPFAIISFFTTNPITIYYAGLSFFFFISFIISHYSMKSFSGSTKQAVIFAVVYNFSTYRLIEMIARSSIAEYIATIFLPLCLLGFYEVVFRDFSKWKTLVVGISMVIFSHIITTFLLIILFAILIVVNFRFIDRLNKRLVSLVKAVTMTILATSIFTVPFIIEETFQKFGVPSPTILKGENISKLVMSSWNNTSNRAIEGNVYNIGPILLMILIVGILFYKRFEKKYRIVYWISICSFLLSTNLFPWKLLQNTPINVIQFPFRILMFTTLFTGVITAKIIELSSQEYRVRTGLVIAGMFIVINCGLWSISFNSSVHKTLLSRDDLVITNKMIRENKVPDSYLEQYIPKNAQSHLDDVVNHNLEINGEVKQVKPKISQEGNVYTLRNIDKGDIIDIPVTYYKGTVVETGNRRVPVYRNKKGSSEIIAPKDHDKLVLVTSYQNNKVYLAIVLVTILSWIIIIIPRSLYKKINYNTEQEPAF